MPTATSPRPDAPSGGAGGVSAPTSAAEVLRPRAEVGREGGALSPALSGRIQAKRGGGQPLEATVRQGMEGVFGVDFSPVRIHADSEADGLNRGVAAIAFTVGSDIFFRAGFYQPQSTAGQHLLAHELTHVVQQRMGSLGTSGGGGASGGTMTVGAADDRHEQEAEQTAHRVVAALQARWQALTAPATSPGAALSRAHAPAVALAPAAPGIARAAAPPAPRADTTGLVCLPAPRPGAIAAVLGEIGAALLNLQPRVYAPRIGAGPLPVGTPVLVLGHTAKADWAYLRVAAGPLAGREGWVLSAAVTLAPAAPRGRPAARPRARRGLQRRRRPPLRPALHRPDAGPAPALQRPGSGPAPALEHHPDRGRLSAPGRRPQGPGGLVPRHHPQRPARLCQQRLPGL